VGGEYNPQIKRFDHHQLSYNGEMSSAGMIWSYLKNQQIITDCVYDFLNNSLIIGIDAHDNGRVLSEGGVCTFSNVISNFTPVRHDVSAEEQDRAFKEALDFVMGYINRAMQRFSYAQGCKEKVRIAMEKQKRVLFFDETMPWIDSFFELGGENHPAQFVVMPSGNQWKVRGIPPHSIDRMKVRKPLPKEWAGLLEEEFKRVCGIPGAVFCHKGRFISVWKTKEDALRALDYILEQGE
jgi:uncharacterized UPF0160 family protein